MTTDLFIPPAAEGLPLAALDSATTGADRLDAAALTPTGRNFLAHALVQLARDGWLRTEPGEGLEPVQDREAPEPQPAVSAVVSPPTSRAELRKAVAHAIHRYDNHHALSGNDVPSEHHYGEADAVLAVLPEPTDRAAVLLEAADHFDRMGRTVLAASQVRDELHRMAVEARPCRWEHPHPGYQCEPRTAVEAHDTGTQQQAAEAPASFVLWLDASDGSVPTHDGIQWPDGTTTIHHRHFGITTTHHDSEAARRAAHGEQGRIVWPHTADEPASVAQQPAAEAEQDDTVHACPGRWGGPNCRCFDAEPAPGEQQTAAADDEETPSRAVLLDLVRDFLDADPCSFDHHGYCQAHGWLGGEPGSCPHGRARKLIPGIDEDTAP